MIKKFVRIGVGVLTTILVLMAVWYFRIVVTYVLISLLFAASIRSLFTRLVGIRLFSRILWILAYSLVVLGLLIAVYFAVQASVAELSNLTQGVSMQDQLTLPVWIQTSLKKTRLTWVPFPNVPLQMVIGPYEEQILPVLLDVAQNFGGMMTAGAIILILSIYWNASKVHYERLWLSLLPSDKRKRARDIWETIEYEIGDYIRGQGLLSLLIGVCLGIGFWIFGSPSPVFLGLIGTLASLMPFIGWLLIIIPTVIIGLLTSLEIAILTGIYSIVVLIVVSIWIKPKLLKRRWDGPILTLILMIALADVFGIVGIIVAPAISAICLILWNRLIVHRAASDAPTDLSDLKKRIEKINQSIEALEKPHPPLIVHSMERISKLINEAEPIISKNQHPEFSETHLPSN